MLKPTTIKRAALALAVAGTVGASAFGGSVSADPMQYSAARGVGSDTTQEVMNAFAGYSTGVDYTPVHSSAATGSRQIVSFDALGTDCITPGLGAPSVDRPNGSTNGRKALSRAFDGTGWGKPTASGGLCGGTKDVSGLLEFARSSSGASGTTGKLTYIPFGRDALSFAYYRAAGSPVTELTRAQLRTLFSEGGANASITVNGVRIIGCAIQLGSGTQKDFQSKITGGNNTALASTTNECNDLLGADVYAQENKMDLLKARGDALAAIAGHENDQVVIGFSASAFIAQSNGASTSSLPTGVDGKWGIGSISDDSTSGTGGNNLGSPVTGSAPTLSANTTFFSNSTFGRDVYNVVDTDWLSVSPDLQSLFVGSTSAICTQTVPGGTQLVLEKFGFLSKGASCGSTTTTGDYISGTFNS